MLNLVHYQPWSLMNHWRRELDQVFNVPAVGPEPAFGHAAAWMPSVDVQELNDAFLVRADIPGVNATDIEVTAEDGVLTVRGERIASDPVAGNGFESIERVAGTFMRRFALPVAAHTADIKANYVNGVLEIRIPKTPRPESKRISVTVN